MAEQVKQEVLDEIGREDYQRISGEMARQKELASEYAGHAGKVVSGAVERWGIDKKAFGLMQALRKKPEDARAVTLRAILRYAQYEGFFDDVDLFDSTLSIMREIIDEAEKRQHNGTATKEPDAINEQLAE